MTREARLYAVAIGAILALCAVLSVSEYAHSQGGGFPSFPSFGGVNIASTGTFACGPFNYPTALCVNGISGDWSAIIQGSSNTGQSNGLFVGAGTNSSDYSFQVLNYADNTSYLLVYGDGGVRIGNGGTDQGAGTLNVLNGIYVNGVLQPTPKNTITVVATTTQSITSSTTYTNDSTISVALTSGKYYNFDCTFVFVNSAGASGGSEKMGWTYSGTGGYMNYGGSFYPNATVSVQGSSGNQSLSTTASSFVSGAPNATEILGITEFYDGVVYGGSVGGTLQMQWAQETSSATATVRQAGSGCVLTQLN